MPDFFALEGQPLLVIQRQLGHRRASTTSEYLHRIAPEALVRAIRERPAWTEECAS